MKHWIAMVALALLACQSEPPPETVYLHIEQRQPGCKIESSGTRTPAEGAIKGTTIVIGGAELHKVQIQRYDLLGQPTETLEPPASRWLPVKVQPEQDRIRYRLDLTILDIEYRRVTIDEVRQDGPYALVVKLLNTLHRSAFRIFLGPTVEGKELVCELEGDQVVCSKRQEV